MKMWKQLKEEFSPGYKKLLYCNYCGFNGHLEDSCKKKKMDEERIKLFKKCVYKEKK